MVAVHYPQGSFRTSALYWLVFALLFGPFLVLCADGHRRRVGTRSIGPNGNGNGNGGIWTKYGLPKECGNHKKEDWPDFRVSWCQDKGLNRRSGRVATSSEAHERFTHANCVSIHGSFYFPPFVFLVKKNAEWWLGKEQQCNGVLISDRLVLTSQACLDERKVTTSDSFGVVRSATFYPDQKITGIERIIPGNIQPRVGSMDWNDVAILVLKEREDVSNGTAACLPETNLWTEGNRKDKWLLSMGAVFNKTGRNVYTPKFASVIGVNKEKCSGKFTSNDRRETYILTTEEITATCFSPNRHRLTKIYGSPCFGDNGAPIFARDAKERLTVIGMLAKATAPLCKTGRGAQQDFLPFTSWASDLHKLAKLRVLQKQLEKVGKLR